VTYVPWHRRPLDDGLPFNRGGGQARGPWSHRM